jgi:hypothetical protein
MTLGDAKIWKHHGERAFPTLESLLEQHDDYDIGDGFSVSRRPGQDWHIYYKAKHVDCWDAEHRGESIPNDLMSFTTAVSAVSAAYQVKIVAPWFVKAAADSMAEGDC